MITRGGQVLRMTLGLLLLAWPFATRAKDACSVVLEPENANAQWQAAKAAAVKRLAGGGAEDCREVTIAVKPDGHATLTFVTVDGRQASRALQAPADLVPTLEALLVTLPPEPAPSASVAPSVTASASTSAPDPAPPVVSSARPAPSPPEDGDRRFLVAPAVGARFGLDEDLASPMLTLRTVVRLRGFELGVRGEWNPLYSSLRKPPPPSFTMYSGFADLVAGRRLALGAVELPVGLSFGLGGTYEKIDAQRVRTLESRAGAFSGVTFALDASVRFALGVAFDLTLTGLRKGGVAEKGLLPLMQYGLGLSLGMEVSP